MLHERRRSAATQLSGGEQQMLALARVLRMGARLLLCDEPTEGLSPLLVAQVGDILRQVRDQGTAVLLVEQNLHFATTVADRHYLLAEGRVVETLRQRRGTRARARTARVPRNLTTQWRQLMDKRATGAAVVTVALLLSGCGGGGPQSRRTASSPATRSCSASSTTSRASISTLSGTNSVKAVEMAIADFKAKHGDKAVTDDIEVVTADHQNKPDVANSKAAELYDRQGVDTILDVPTSSAALAVADVAKEKKKLYFNISAATTDLTGKSCNKYTFHYAYDTYMLANGTGTTVTEQGAKNWYIVYPDYAFGQDMEKTFSTAVDRRPAAPSSARTRRRSRTTTSPRSCSRRRR